MNRELNNPPQAVLAAEMEQVAQLLPDASFQMIAGADHHIWVTHAEELRVALRDFIQQIAGAGLRS